MRVAFVQNLWEEQIGPLILAEILEQRGHRVRFFLPESGWKKRLFAFSPAVVAFSVSTGHQDWYLAVARQIKEQWPSPPKIIMGGPHATFFPDVIRHPALDAICRGEGERALPLFLEGLESGEIPTDVPNLQIKVSGQVFENPLGPLIQDLDEFPFPTRAALYRDYPFLRTSPFKKTLASRGCPFNCRFCYNRRYRELTEDKGHYLRQRSVGHVLAELAHVRDYFGLDYLDFQDDIFTWDKEWVLEFSGRYKREVNRPFCCQIHPHFLDRDIVRALKNAGCRSVAFGVESGNESLRREVLGKITTNKDIVQTAELLHSQGLAFRTYNILGLPGETLAQAMDTVRLNQKIRPFYAGSTLLTPFPGNSFEPLWESPAPASEKESAIKSWYAETSVPGPDKEAISNLQKWFSILVRHPSLEPLVMKLIRLGPNFFFRLASQAYFGIYTKRRVGADWSRLLRFFIKVHKHY